MLRVNRKREKDGGNPQKPPENRCTVELVLCRESGGIKMTIERAIEILNPEHREYYDSIKTVNEACRIGIGAL